MNPIASNGVFDKLKPLYTKAGLGKAIIHRRSQMICMESTALDRVNSILLGEVYALAANASDEEFLGILKQYCDMNSHADLYKELVE